MSRLRGNFRVCTSLAGCVLICLTPRPTRVPISPSGVYACGIEESAAKVTGNWKVTDAGTDDEGTEEAPWEEAMADMMNAFDMMGKTMGSGMGQHNTGRLVVKLTNFTSHGK